MHALGRLRSRHYEDLAFSSRTSTNSSPYNLIPWLKLLHKVSPPNSVAGILVGTRAVTQKLGDIL